MKPALRTGYLAAFIGADKFSVYHAPGGSDQGTIDSLHVLPNDAARALIAAISRQLRGRSAIKNILAILPEDIPERSFTLQRRRYTSCSWKGSRCRLFPAYAWNAAPAMKSVFRIRTMIRVDS